MKRRWFTYDDGTFYRNCPLIEQEAREARRRCRWGLVQALNDEWWETFRRGVQYKETLGKHDVALPDPQTPLSVLLPGLRAKVSADSLAAMEARLARSPSLPGDPKFRWCWPTTSANGAAPASP